MSTGLKRMGVRQDIRRHTFVRGKRGSAKEVDKQGIPETHGTHPSVDRRVVARRSSARMDLPEDP